MAPKKWTTPEQEEWLQPWYSKYKETLIGKVKNYTNFFCNLNEAWFDEFPEPRPSTVTPYGPLTEEEIKIMDAAEKSRTNKLYNRFKNSMGSMRAGRQAKADAVDVLQAVVESILECEKSTRAYQEQEAYSVLFYKERAQPQEALKALKATGERLTSGQCVALVKKETAKAYEAETDEIKMQVKEFIEQQKVTQEKDKKEGIWSEDNSNYQQNLDKLAAVVNKFLKGLHNATGLSYTLLAGGPSPESGGLIDCYSFHVGLTKLGNDFSKAYPEFDAGIMEPFRDYLYRVYPEAAVKRAGENVGSKALNDASLLRFSPDSLAADISQQGSPTHQHILARSDVSDHLPPSSPLLPSSPFPTSSSDDIFADSFNNSYSSDWDSNFSHGPSNLMLPDISGSLPLSRGNTSADLHSHSGSFLDSDPNLPDENGTHFWMRPDFDAFLLGLESSSVLAGKELPQPALTQSLLHTAAPACSPTTFPTTASLHPTEQLVTSLTTDTPTLLAPHAPHMMAPTSPSLPLHPTEQLVMSLTTDTPTLPAPHAPHTMAPTSPSLPLHPTEQLVMQATTTDETQWQVTNLLTSSADANSTTSASYAPATADPDGTENVATADCDTHIRHTRTGRICKPSTRHVTANAIGNHIKDVSAKRPHEHAGGSSGVKSKRTKT